MPDAIRPLRFPAALRLKLSADFEAVYQRRCKVGDGLLLVFARLNGGGPTRLGLSVSRKVGPAVVRNRIKRLLREAFRQLQHDLPAGLDLIAIPTARERAGLVAYREALPKLVRRLQRRLEEPPLPKPEGSA